MPLMPLMPLKSRGARGPEAQRPRRSTTVEFATSEDDRIQVMAPGDAYYEFSARNAAGPVPLFEVDDVQQARRELEQAGAEVIGGHQP